MHKFSEISAMNIQVLAHASSKAHLRGNWRLRLISLILSSFIAMTAALSYDSLALAQSGTCSGMALGQLSSLNGFVPFPSSNLWNTDISSSPVDSNSDNIINYIGSPVTLHPDFGSGTYADQTIGIPYQVVSASQKKVVIKLGAYASESDPGADAHSFECVD
jgi:hypothetical protein